MKNAVAQNISKKSNDYTALDTIDYFCNKGFHMEGNKSVFCTYTGEWSESPKCLPTTKFKSHLLAAVLSPILFLLTTLLIMVTVKHRMHLKAQKKADMETKQVEFDVILMETNAADRPLLPLQRKLDFKRNKLFDAFVLYHFDSGDDFVLNHILPELEEKRKFRLNVHSRDFRAGHDIKDNIEEAIESSNSAIIVMSQGFVDSMWCKEEFKHCYIEIMKDAAFNLFVIMMQPADTLVNISNYIKKFITNKTYLYVNDVELFAKLATNLNNARQPEYDTDNNSSIEAVNDDDDDDDDDDEHSG